MAKKATKATKAMKRAIKPAARQVAKRRAVVPALLFRQPMVHYATLYLFGDAERVSVGSVTPERLTARVGDRIDWTIVDATGARVDPKRVSIRWKDAGNPLTSDPVFEQRCARATIRRGAKGVFRYALVLDGQDLFDPQIEIMV